jgi:DNA-binding CsgD family transcriptional regulator
LRTAATSLAETPRTVPQALCPLIEALGTREFRHRLFASVERMIGAGATAVYAAAGAGLRPVLGDWQAGHGQLERHTREFAGRYAALDPAYRAFGDLVQRPGARACLTTSVARDELPHPGHRILMDEARFADRIVTLFPAPGAAGWFSLHVLRCRSHGPVSDRMLSRFAEAAPVLGSLIGRHLDMAAGVEARLLARFPQLTAREAGVCLALLRGRSAPGIALDLGLEVSSVHTYRKRAYRKLGVGSLPALFQLLFNGDEIG